MFLDGIDDPHTHYVMTETYNARMIALRTTAQESWTWSTALDVQLESARLHLFAMTFIQEPHGHDAQVQMYRCTMLQNLLKSASSLISTMTGMSNQEISGHHYFGGILTFYPKHYFLSLILATSCLFRFLIASRNTTQTQQLLAITRITEAHKIFQSFPDHRNAMRACITIELAMGYIYRLAHDNNRDMFIKNRLGASIVLDMGFRAAQQRNFNPLDGTTAPMTQWPDMGVTFADRLPLAPEQKITSPNSTGIVPVTASMLSGDIVDDTVMNVAAWDTWNIYSNDFGIMNEPWLGDDAEFALGIQPPMDVSMAVALPSATSEMNR